jgi:predicted RecB family nuclease
MISNEVFVGFLNCRRKAFFKQAGQVGEMTQIEQVQRQLDKTDARAALDRFMGQEPKGDVLRDPPTLETAIQSLARFIVGATAQAGNLCSRLDLLERQADGQSEAPLYGPVLFVRNSKVTKNDRLLLAFQALALSLVQGKVPVAGKIVCGSEHRVVRVHLASLVEEVRQLLAVIEADSKGEAAPILTLNRHCTACEFRKGCQTLAEQTDDLSLLRCLSEKEILHQRSRGVTTLTQFSHSYRPGRRGKRRSGKARKHDPALQALALREKKVYVMDVPALAQPEVALYLDIEGVPDLDFYYLVGLLVVEQDRSSFHCFWADDTSQERAAWDACAQLIGTFPNYTLYHYGQYERRFLEQMKKRGNEIEMAAIDRILGRSCNILSAIYSHVYFPTRSNSLKDVAGLLGFRWSAEGASGLQAMAWRLIWESGKEESLKHQLLQYNQEDCLALRRVTEFVLSVCAEAPADSAEGQPPVAQADDLKLPGAFRLGKTKFFCPELEYINKCAYSDYQRERVYVRTSQAVRRSQKRKLRGGKRTRILKVNHEVECDPPQKCPECGSEKVGHRSLLPSQTSRKVVFDLKFTRTGVKRWVVRYSSLRYECGHCQATFHADEYRAARPRLGPNLSVWAIYHHVALRQTYEDVAQSLNDLFGFSFPSTMLSKIKPRLTAIHQTTFEKLKDKLRRGSLTHADETKAQVKGHSGYVWAFTNLEEVVYVYTPTRDGDILEKVLEGFTGVLVSDFYAAYDGVKCLQQKCLVHLMRDVNDDLFHSPFDEELKYLAQRLVGVLKPIIDTVDKYGLKRHFLHKHKQNAEGYFEYLATHQFQSELARKYQKRMLKYRGKLFTFLDHDGVPWNNNNAELAIKRFAKRRRIMGASFTATGLQDYLIFLSIYQTCQNKNVSFLRFLRSGLLDLDAFVDSQRSR